MPDNEPSAGVTPAAAGVTPAQTPPAGSTPVDPPPVTGSADLAVDPDRGAKTALEAERKTARDALKRASDAEKALEDYKLAGASDADKALAKAKAEGAAEVTAKWSAQVRRSEVKSALTAAGINASVLDLAVNAPEFGALTVSEEGEVEGLAAAIDTFRKAKADLFTKPATPGTADGGTHGTPSLTRDQIAKMTPDQINARWEEVGKALATAK